MRLAEVTVPKMNPEAIGNEDGRLGGFSFCPLESAVENALPRFGGKILFYSDARTIHRFAPFSRGIRSVSVVSEPDALSLFTMPDGVSAVFAAGGEETVKAARFFAHVMRIPCLLFPADGRLTGVFEPTGEILLGGERAKVGLAEAEICLDVSLMKPTMSEAFSSILLDRLALIESSALQLFYRVEKPSCFDEAYKLTELFGTLTHREIVSRNATLRRLEGLPARDGVTLVKLHAEAGDSYPVWRSFCELSALYCAFFEVGKPRRYFVPDYAERAKQAGVEYFMQRIPTRAEYAGRAVLLERMRAPFGKELGEILSRKGCYERVFRSLAETNPPRLGAKLLKILPERSPNGLSAIIRDFGLMDF